MNMNRRQFIFGGLLLFVVVVFVIKNIVLPGSVVKLKQAPPLAGAVSQSLNTTSNGSLPQFGKDYSLQDVRYFDNRTWATASVVPLKIHTDTATAVMYMVNGSYQVVLGPGTAFPNSYLSGLPDDVRQYLINKGIIYEPTTTP